MCRRIIGPITLILFVIVVTSRPAESKAPKWFFDLPHERDEIIGYGQGKTKSEAETMAKREIAHSVCTHIRAESRIEDHLENEKYTQKINALIEENTDVILTELKVIEATQKGGKWYVAIKYDNMAIEQKMARRFATLKITDEKQNRYLAKTPLMTKIHKVFGKRLDIRLRRGNGIWYLTYQGASFPLKPNELEKLFVGFKGKDLDLRVSKTELVEGDVFSFEIIPKQNGYVSLLNVCEDGKVFVLAENKEGKTGKKILFPGPSDPNELFAGINIKGKATYDLIVGIVSDSRINLNRVQNAKTDLPKEEIHYKFDEVVDLMDNHSFNTILIRTIPREK